MNHQLSAFYRSYVSVLEACWTPRYGSGEPLASSQIVRRWANKSYSALVYDETYLQWLTCEALVAPITSWAALSSSLWRGALTDLSQIPSSSTASISGSDTGTTSAYASLPLKPEQYSCAGRRGSKIKISRTSHFAPRYLNVRRWKYYNE